MDGFEIEIRGTKLYHIVTYDARQQQQKQRSITIISFLSLVSATLIITTISLSHTTTNSK